MLAEMHEFHTHRGKYHSAVARHAHNYDTPSVVEDEKRTSLINHNFHIPR